MIAHTPPIHAARAGGLVKGAGVVFQHLTASLTGITGIDGWGNLEEC